MSEPLSQIRKELRRAVETQHYAEVRRLVLAFCEAAAAHARALPPGDPRIGEIAALTQEVLVWARAMVQASRSCLILQLRRIPKIKQYIPFVAAPASSMHLDV